MRPEPLRVALRRPFAGVVRIVGELHAPHLAQHLPQFIGEALRAKQTRHVVKAAGAERQRVEDGFAQDNFVSLQRFAVQQAAMRPGRIQVFELAPRRRRARHAPPVEAHDLTALVMQRHGDAAVEVLVAALAPQAKLLQPRSQPVALAAVLHRQAQAQRPVGEAELEAVNQFVAVQSTRSQIRPRRCRLLQPFVIVAGHLAQQRRVIRRRIERTRQARHGRLLLQRRSRERDIAALVQQLEGVTERNAVVLRDELDGVARLAAGHAMEQPLVRRDDEVGRVLVGVERAAPDPVLAAVLLQLNAPALDQRPQVGAALHPLDVRFRNAPGHWLPPFGKTASSPK
ncbi:MAG: hypothetical protein BWX48_00070 [Verrucomicrobia bacterium ADurb.Bin006]|nr:MAG: hypothetical protein BWX48_00070 [Verrucomicrobia bacterium ADurb.Bin006]